MRQFRRRGTTDSPRVNTITPKKAKYLDTMEHIDFALEDYAPLMLSTAALWDLPGNSHERVLIIP